MKQRLVIDHIGCDGRGACAELFPERITLDDWGYPIVDPTPIPQSMLRDAKRAVQLCPVLALRLEAEDTPGRRIGGEVQDVQGRAPSDAGGLVATEIDGDPLLGSRR